MSTKKHVHYLYNFGEALCCRTIKYFVDTDKVKILVGGGQYFCTFVTKCVITHAASRTRQYQTPPTRNVSNQLRACKTTIYAKTK